MLKSFRYRIYPTPEQEVFLNKTFGCCRYVYNHFLALRNQLYEEQKKSLSCFDMIKQLTTLRREQPFLAEIACAPEQQVLFHLDNAFTNFFKKQASYPGFKSKHLHRDSFSVPREYQIVDSKLHIPKLKTGIKIVLDRPPEGALKTLAISRNPAGQYFASILCETGEKLPEKEKFSAETTVGIDLGIKDFAVLSSGEVAQNPKYLTKSLQKLAKEQRRLSHTEKGSRNHEKQRRKVAKVYQHITNQRNNFLHNLTYRLTHENQVSTLCIEDLGVEELLQKKELSRCIADVSWGRFRELLTYKCDWYGKNLVVIPQNAPSTMLCPVCGSINKQLTLADREWICPTCGTHHDRDLNAAQNIRRFGLEQIYRRQAEKPLLPRATAET